MNNNIYSFIAPVTNRIFLNTLNGKKIGIDANNWLLKVVKSSPKNFLMSTKYTDLINFIMEEVSLLKSNDIIPVFIFLGPLNSFQEIYFQKQNEIKKKMLEDASELEIKAFSNKSSELYRISYQLNDQLINQFILRLKTESIEYKIPNIDNKFYLTNLCENEEIDFIYSDDPFIFLYQPKKLLFFLSSNLLISSLNFNDLLEYYSFSKEKLISFFMLSGLCYCKNPLNLSLIKLFKDFKNNKNINEYFINFNEFKKDFFNEKLIYLPHQNEKNQKQLDLFGKEASDSSTNSPKKRISSPKKIIQNNSILTYFPLN